MWFYLLLFKTDKWFFRWDSPYQRAPNIQLTWSVGLTVSLKRFVYASLLMDIVLLVLLFSFLYFSLFLSIFAGHKSYKKNLVNLYRIFFAKLHWKCVDSILNWQIEMQILSFLYVQLCSPFQHTISLIHRY